MYIQSIYRNKHLGMFHRIIYLSKDTCPAYCIFRVSDVIQVCYDLLIHIYFTCEEVYEMKMF